MKALPAFLFIWLCAFGPAIAQTHKAFYVGARAGLNLSDIRYLQGARQHFGFHATGHVSYKFARLFRVLAEPGFSQNGTEARSVTYRLNYVQVPVLLQFQLNQLGLQGGFYRATLLNASGYKNNLTTNIANTFNRSDFGLSVGFVFEPEQDFFIGLRYYHGLQNINQSFLSTGILTNRTLQISGGYKFKLKPKTPPEH